MRRYKRIFSLFALGLCLTLLNCGGDSDSAPGDFRAVASNAQVTLAWTATDGIDYHLHYSTTPGIDVNSGKVRKRRFTLPPYIHSGLTNGTTYYYRLTASDSSGPSDPTDEVSATPLATPQGFTAAGLRQRVRLFWTPQPGITYTLFYSTTLGIDVESAGVMRFSNVTSPYDHENLTNGTVYYYRLRAMNPSGASDPTAEVSAIPIPVVAPRDFTAQGLSQGVKLTWSVQRGVTYDLFHSTNPGIDVEDMNSMRLLDVMPPYTHPDLTDGTTYYYILKTNDISSMEASAAFTNEISGTPGLQISAGGTHTCAVVGGAAKCWGGNANGQLGNGGDSDSNTPQQVHGLTAGVTQISAGGSHTCAVVDGAALCWGLGLSGRLGNDSESVAYLPQRVHGLASGVTQISAGSSHTCAVAGGRALCWGWGTSGQLGNNGILNASTPQQVTGLTRGVTQISAGSNHTCAIVEGRVVCWGSARDGRLGNNLDWDSDIPQPNTGFINRRGAFFPLPQLVAVTPQQVTNLTSGVVTQISAGGAHTCAVVDGGTWCWGEGGSGRLGHNDMPEEIDEKGNPVPGTGPNMDKLVPTQVDGLTSGVTQISAGDAHTCAVVDGRAMCWGEGDNSRLGHGEINFVDEDSVNADKDTPTQVEGLTSGIVQVSGGQAHSCAVTDDGMACWGRAGNGRLGNNAAEDSPVPASVRGF